MGDPAAPGHHVPRLAAEVFGDGLLLDVNGRTSP
jgi:hypothetical protein